MNPLITVDDLKEYANLTQQGSSAPAGQSITNICNEVINGWTGFVYRWTGLCPDTLTAVTTFTDTVSGNGSRRLFLNNFPIVSVTSVVVNGRTIPQSTAYGVAGWFIEDNKTSIAIRDGSGSFSSFCGSSYSFAPGIGNVSVSYTAGYEETPSDLYEWSLKACTVLVNRRTREDQASQAIPNSGETSYRSWAFAPEVLAGLQPYRRIWS